MKKGAVPVPYIIALILGIVVVGLLAYWFFFLGGKIGPSNLSTDCRSKANSYCTTWASCNYASTCSPGSWDNYAPGCSATGGVTIRQNVPANSARYDCNLYVFGLARGGSACANNAQCASATCTANVCTTI